MNCRNVSRKESMSPDGFLKLIQQEDGDMIVVVAGGRACDGVDRAASVEFCTPMSGGGGSPATYAALVQLAKAMNEDNREAAGSRSGEFDDQF